MKARNYIAGLVVAVAVLAFATVAVAEGVLSVTPFGSPVTYPHSARVVITTPAAVAETISIETRAVDGEWTAWRSIPATQAALATTFTVFPKLKATSGIRVIQAGVESEVATVGVKAGLNALVVTRKHGSVWTVKGTITPAHAIGTTITVQVWKKTVTGKGKSRVTELTQLPDVAALVYKTNGNISWYKATFVRPSAGTYVFKALHADAAHIENVSKPRTVKIKR